MDKGVRGDREGLRSSDTVDDRRVMAPRQRIADDGRQNRQSMAPAELTRFDRSRREFLKLSGLTLAGLILPAPLWRDTVAYGAPAPVRIDRAVAWALQDVQNS